jgi:hypothetical protein
MPQVRTQSKSQSGLIVVVEGLDPIMVTKGSSMPVLMRSQYIVYGFRPACVYHEKYV